jgi:hypothetical protein
VKKAKSIGCFVALLIVVLPGTGVSGDPWRAVYEKGSGGLVEDLCIGDEESDDYLLYAPSAVDVDSHGNIFVVDLKLNCVKKFSPDGEYISTFGGKGEGPGEFVMPLPMVVDREDNVIVWDYGNRRFTIFDDEGHLVRAMSFQPTVTRIECTPGGFLLVETEEGDFSSYAIKTKVKLTRYSKDFTKPVVVDSAYVEKWKRVSKGDANWTVTYAYYPTLFWAAGADDEIIIGNSREYKIRILSSDLKQLHVIEKKADRVEVTKEEADQYYVSFEKGNELFKNILRDEVKLPKYKPYFDGIFVGGGYILVMLNESAGDEVLYDVFGPDGSYEASVRLPSLGGKRIRGDYIYGRKDFENELPKVCRFRLDG